MADKDKSEETDRRNEIKHEKLFRELNKIKQVERSDLRMLETARNRFRSKLKRFEVPQLSSGSEAMDVRMYDTHNPGFCYHCTGAIRACDTSPRKKLTDVFDVVHSMLFTNGEVDPDKVLCLHVLAAHYANSGTSESSKIRPITPLVEKGKNEHFRGAWNSVLPCYVLDIQRNVDDSTHFSDEMKRHEDPLVMEAEEEIVKDFEYKYEKYLEENFDVGLALSTNHKRMKMVPNGIGQMTIIPPHVYSLLGAAQELRIKQAVAEESRRKKFRHSNSSIKNVDDQSISFRLDDEDDGTSRRLMTVTSIRGWNGSRIMGNSRISGFRSLSRKSTSLSHKTNPSIATLEHASPRSSEVPLLSKDIHIDKEFVTIKPSDRAMGRIVSKTSSTKSPFRKSSNTHSPGSPCSNSINSGMFGSFGESKKIVRPIFINSPAESPELRNKAYKTVPILVNNQMQALVHSVLDILERVNPSKMHKIVSTAKNPYEIRRMLIRSDIQLFIDSLVGQPLISSPNSFVISLASILNEIDPRVESSIEKEMVATTLAVSPAPGLHRLVEEIRNNIFMDPEQAIGSKADTRIETFRDQKQKLLGSRLPYMKSEDGKDVFDVDTSCLHSDIQGTKMTCACCYAKWKESLPETKRLKVPDFSFLVDNEIGMTSEKVAKYETNICDMYSASIKREDVIKSQSSDKKEKSCGIPSLFARNQNIRETTEAVIVKHAEIIASKPSVNDSEVQTDLSLIKTKYSQSSRSKPSKKGAFKSIGSGTLQRTLSSKAAQEPRASLDFVDQKSRLDQTEFGDKLFEESMRVGAKTYRQKKNVDQINEAQSYKGSTSTSGLTAGCGSMVTISLQKRCSKIVLEDDEPSPKCQFKPWKASQNPGYLEPDRIILRRMTNPQRILVGQMCASLKTRKTNMEGLVKERMPLVALITPALSREALRILTKGTREAKSRKREMIYKKDDYIITVSENLTGPVLAKIRQAVAENETSQRLKSFLKSRI